MKRIIGIGGVFFKARDPVALRAWYQKHLGIAIETWGGTTFEHGSTEAGQPPTAWRIAPADDASFVPSTTPFMINYLVADLAGLLQTLRDEGCEVLSEFDEGPLGKFGWILDPEGNKIELWQAPQQDNHANDAVLS